MAQKTLERLQSSTKPEELFRFITQRQPVIIKGLPDDEHFKAKQWVRKSLSSVLINTKRLDQDRPRIPKNKSRRYRSACRTYTPHFQAIRNRCRTHLRSVQRLSCVPRISEWTAPLPHDTILGTGRRAYGPATSGECIDQ